MASRPVASQLAALRKLVGSRFYVLDARGGGDRRGVTLVLKLNAREERLLQAPIATLLNRGVVRFMAEFFARPRRLPKAKPERVEVIARRNGFALYRARLPRALRGPAIF